MKLLLPLTILTFISCSPQSRSEQGTSAETDVPINDSSLSEIATSDKPKIGSIDPKKQMTDSLQLTLLVQNMFEWHETYRLNDFPYKYDNSDTIFVGIDWHAYNQLEKRFDSTQFFSNHFLQTHRSIATEIDSSIKQSSIEWRNILDGIPYWETGADNWCACQDYPDEYWKLISLHNIQIEGDSASFQWTWNTDERDYPHHQAITAVLVNDQWRISSIQGITYLKGLYLDPAN